MTTPAITLTVQDSGVINALLNARSALASMRKVNRAVGATLESRMHQRFDTKTTPKGRPWKDWAPSTAAARAKEGRGTLLEYTGRLRDSLAYQADDQGVLIGFGVPYAGHVNEARPLLFEGHDLSQADTDAVVAAALKTLRQLIP